ncbi:MAG: hypothetical protein Q8M03_08945, partial [Legionella sp.]|nr:hypothetical protein [Legionella sp.]
RQTKDAVGKVVRRTIRYDIFNTVNSASANLLNCINKKDVLVNNAGVIVGKPFFELTEQDVRRTFDVNTLVNTSSFSYGLIPFHSFSWITKDLQTSPDLFHSNNGIYTLWNFLLMMCVFNCLTSSICSVGRLISGPSRSFCQG